MQKIIGIICVFYLCVGLGVSQEINIDNHDWQVVSEENSQFRLPDTWQKDDDIWSNPDNSGTLRMIENNEAILDFFPTAEIISEENIDLPIGQALKTIASDETVQIQSYSVQNITLIISIPLDSPETEQAEFFAIVAQIANTLTSTQANEDTWSLFASADATIFLQTPLSWSKETSNDDTISVNQIFDDALISITYRDLGRPFELEEVTEQFETIYRSNSYDIRAQEIVNLPIGNALYFRLGDVRVTSSSTHTQLHYAIARDNYLIVVTAGADETYFSEYEPILLQIIDTIRFEMP